LSSPFAASFCKVKIDTDFEGKKGVTKVSARAYDRFWLLSASFALGAMLVVIVVSWQEVSVFYRVAYVILFVGLLCSFWSKQKTNDGDNDSDNNPRNIFISKPRHKSSNSTAKS
jgi:hypothetical protein